LSPGREIIFESMGGMENLGKILIITGAVIAVMGLIFLFWNKVPFLGKLPGDIFFHRGSFQIIFPVATFLLISLVLTVIINLVIWFSGR